MGRTGLIEMLVMTDAMRKLIAERGDLVQLRGQAARDGLRSLRVSGAEKIAKLFATTTRRYPDHGNIPRTRHLVLNPVVEFDTDGTAATRSTFCVVQDTETVPIQPIVVGRYYDRFGRDDGGWYFTERKVEIQMIGDVSAHLMVDPAAYEK
ncbi:MAG: nuclear transport factor 2 family protein [Mycobacterium sp.]